MSMAHGTQNPAAPLCAVLYYYTTITITIEVLSNKLCELLVDVPGSNSNPHVKFNICTSRRYFLGPLALPWPLVAGLFFYGY